MSKGIVRHMFPGGNTPRGFFSYYDNILPQEEATRIIVIKGGPGVGKSSFMKKIAKEMLDEGYDVEMMHCSSDPNSLDGVVIPGIKVAFMDGTAPHIVDPKNPGAVDEIIHLGDYWNETGIRANKEYIMKDNKEVGKLFARAYKYLSAANAIYEDTNTILVNSIDNAKVNSIGALISEEVFEKTPLASREGKFRKLFASAITPEGLKNYLDSLINTPKVYILKGECGIDKVLDLIARAAIIRGLYVEGYFCPMNPSKLEHLIIPELGVSFTTKNKYHEVSVKAEMVIDFSVFLNKDQQLENNDVLEYNRSQFNSLLEKAIKTISQAKALHDHMETYYIPHMDFEAIDRCFENTMARIMDYAAEYK